MLKKLIKRLFSDWIVVFFIAIGVISLLLTLAAFSGGLDPTRYGGINYTTGGTAFHRFLLKMTTPALVIKILLREILGESTWQYLILYPIMFVVQIIIYATIGKIVNALLTNWMMLVFTYTGIVLLALTLAFEVNPIEGSVVNETVKGTAFCSLLLITTLPALIAGMLLLGILGETTFVSIIFLPFMFIVQILLYWIVGKAVWFLYSVAGKGFAFAFRNLK